MTFISPATGQRCSLSWLLPQSHEDLKKKAPQQRDLERALLGTAWAGPDILAPYIITLYDTRNTLSAVRHPRCDFGENVVNYYHHCLEHDLLHPRPRRPAGGPQPATPE